MTSVKDDLPDHALALLGYVMDGMRRDLHARSAAGAGAATGLRSSQLRLLSLTPVDGMRVTDLAERVGMTKQALGEFANALEDRGLMESVRDDQDRRDPHPAPDRGGPARCRGRGRPHRRGGGGLAPTARGAAVGAAAGTAPRGRGAGPRSARGVGLDQLGLGRVEVGRHAPTRRAAEVARR